MNTESKRQYMETLRKKYAQATKKGKGAILDEYCERTKEERKYAIKKFRHKVRVKKPEERKKRKPTYSHAVIAPLVKLWKIFDHPCGSRLKSCIDNELDKLVEFKEINCSNRIVLLLKKISPATIDRRLRHQKEVEKHNLKYGSKGISELYSVVPTKTVADLEIDRPGCIQLDCVEHGGASASGEYLNTLATVDVLSGWWEAEAVMGKSQRAAYTGMDNCRQRFPIVWKQAHPDNGSNILNWQVVRYCDEHNIELSRSRPYHKNDNCYIEQKNSTHVRKHLGYLRFDTPQEQAIINDLYRNELRIYKNFYQPVMKLIEKRRVKGKRHRRYDIPQTPYKRIMGHSDVPQEVKDELTDIYNSTNPAQLRRDIHIKVNELYKIYKKKKGSQNIALDKKLVTSTVSNYLIHQL